MKLSGRRWPNMYEIYACTDVGMIREHNEDCFLINDYIASSGEKHVSQYCGDFILAVADGVGGVNAGEIASRMVLEHLATMPRDLGESDIACFIQALNDKLLSYGEDNPDARGLGTTLAGIVCRGGKVLTFNVGDSRVYRFRDGFLRQLTRDHSLVQSLFEAGQITREEMFRHPNKNILLQFIGSHQPGRLAVDVEALRGEFGAGDIILICSDGLCDMVDHDKIESIIADAPSIQGAASNLVQEAKQRGGEDNITVILAKRYSQD